MTSSTSNARRLRRWAHILRNSPLHPQWFAFQYKEQALREVAAEARGELLDVGCADSVLRSRLDQAVSYTGLDYLETAMSLYRTRPGVFGDAQRLPFRDSCFDRVVLLDVLEHLPRPDEALREAARVLRPGGAVLIHVPFVYPLHDRPFDFWRLTEHGLVELASRAGLSTRMVVARGHAVETAALLLNLALSKALLSTGERFRPALLLGMLLAPAVLAANLLGWLLARCLPAVDFLPLSYWAVLDHAGDAGG